MLGRPLLGAGVRRRAARLATATLAVAAASGTMGGCLTRPLAPLDSRTTSIVVERLAASAVDKIDLLLVVDNSSSMADKQKILGLAIPDLIVGLVNPPCLDATGNPVGTQPGGPLDKCTAGSQREFEPVLDIHVGLISSSLGSFGTNGCPETPSTFQPYGNPTMNDHGHLLSRADAASPGVNGPTYQGLGFLAWDPGGNDKPPGEPNLGLTGPGLVTNLRAMILGDGQLGCGYESQNEAWYRFLVDPTPYQSISFPNGSVVTSDIDTDLIAERKSFLRPDSLLAIINVTDETDTSVKELGGFPLFTEQEHMYRARAECAKSPTDPCCASCAATPQPANCPVDPLCVSKPRYDDTEENIEIRAFGLMSHQVTYGADFFYPPSRYVDALTSTTVTDANGKTVPNPIYSVLDTTSGDADVRDPSLVFYATITGVPWQLIARQKDGVPDLVNGVSSLDPTQVGGFKSSAELSVADGKGHTAWDYIVGDPEKFVAPLSPFMQEKGTQRTGTDPLTGTSVTLPGGTDNPINGHERTIPQPPGDIEYACIFPVLEPINCADPAVTTCDCLASTPADNPLCAPNSLDPDPVTNQPRRTQQIAAKAYPGIKNLAIAKGMKDQGIAASICASQLKTDGPDYGYRPAMRAIIDRLKSVIGGQCLPRQLFPDAAGQVPCVVLEANKAGSPACACTGVARQVVDDVHQHAIQEVQLQDASTVGDCFCEVTPTTGAAVAACQQDDESGATNGWCYVDETHGDAALVTKCPASEKQQVHFVGAGRASNGAADFIICSSDGT